MEYKMDTGLVIFDLDGTLLNTIGDLAVACNAVLAMRGLPQHTYDEYCHFVGNGIMRLVERALPEELRTPYTVAAVRADFVKYYTEHIDVYTKPYEGIPELVAEIARRGVRIAVASNKFQAGTEKLIRLFFPGVEFAAVFGQREGVPLKPDPAVVGEILALTGVAKERVLYVGDSGVDMQTAAAAGVRSVGVTWGFRERAELEQAGLELIARVSRKTGLPESEVAVLATFLTASVTYLVLLEEYCPVYNGIPIGEAAGWEQIVLGIDLLIDKTFKE